MNLEPFVDAVVVAIPVRNEQDRLLNCLISVFAATATLPLPALISVALDSCTDGSESIIRKLAENYAGVRIVSGNWQSAGGTRAAAVAHGLACLQELGYHASHQTWISTTDADSHVPIDWVSSQLTWANAGYDAVAGVVTLHDDHDRTADRVDSFRRNYVVGEHSHTHVHGANMGVRASSYLAAAGFPAVERSEDRDLWNAVLRTGGRVVSPVSICVSTSGRREARVIGGFADAMAYSWT